MKPISRRSFLKSSALIGGGVLSIPMFPKFLEGNIKPSVPPDIVSIASDDPMNNISKALEPFGGIEAFVQPGQSVGLLLNSPWKFQGYYTHPDVGLSMLKLCKEAGAEQLICYKPVREGYWEESQYYDDMKPVLDELIYGDERVNVEVTDGKYMKSFEVFKVFMETDVFINIPVAKHHNGTIFSGMLKGLMGVSSRDTNRHMHSPDGEYTYEKEDYLAGCIADLNLVRKPDLCIMDAGTCALNNGPRGPGDTTSPKQILAGTDPLAMDVYAAKLIGMEPEDIITFTKAKELNLGNNDLNTIHVAR
jgi:uncharacterized protein (DUF362 family)